MIFKVYLKHVIAGDLFELPFTTLNSVEELNKGGNATFTFSYTTVKQRVADRYNTTILSLFTSVFSEMWYEDENNNVLWLGVVNDFQLTRNADTSFTLHIGAIDYFGLLQKRRSAYEEVYTSVDPATIPWILINESQLKTSGNLGITQGVTATTGLTITKKCRREDLNQIISDLSNLRLDSSFDFDIDVTKKFNMYYPTKGTLRSNVVFDDLNINSAGAIVPLLLSMTNSVFARGTGVNKNVPEATAIASSGIVAEYTLLEDIVTNTLTWDIPTLQAQANKFLALNELPLSQVTLYHGDSTDLTTYDVGDTIIVNLVEVGINYQQYRVKKRIVSIDQAGTMLSQVDLLTQ